MNYNQTLEFLFSSLVSYQEKGPEAYKPGLERITAFCKHLGNPQRNYFTIHVAGTNGKGSVSHMLASVLQQAGYRTGLYTSPHLRDFRERILVDGEMIPKQKVVNFVDKHYDCMKELGLSFFEMSTALAFDYFDQSDVEVAVIETGLGGRLDATNAIDNPALVIITSISLDHTAILGDTIEKIAGEKAGIIKPGVPVFFDGSSKKAAEVIKAKAAELGVSCREVTKNAYEIQEVHRKYIAFSRRSAYDKDVIFQVPMCGCYQAMNAELALEASEYLLAGEEIHMDRWKQVLAQLHWEGRMERIGAHITVDGAHNPGAMQAFVESVKALDESERGEMVLLFSAVSDKKYDQMIEYLCENLDVKAYVVTQIEDERGVPAEELADVFRRYTDRPVYCKERLEDAVRTAMNERGETGEIYCLGSLYLVGMMKKLLAGGAIDA